MIYDKSYLRKKYLLKRKNSFSKNDISYMSYKIFFNLKKIPIWNKKFFHIFLSIEKLNEVDTFIIINYIFNKKDILITVPYTNFNNFSIKNCLFKKGEILLKNKYDILEPFYKKLINPIYIDVIFIPLIIFDNRGYRVGYGKGLYDKFIFSCKKNIIKIGLSFFNPIKIIYNIHDNDLNLDIGITPNRIFFFNKKLKKEFENIPNNNN
ncbi:5-formyltetrahydrofolate cyclo-ligase [Blattabacterium cuenoti]|uniref:5-formyltetrahydrofolate cyclo-ligase n=1 Tax=Blattabacterium cuenoti TaxID=1653831 RepID=UPI00163CF688|nr:5-formyltetrahydrofolate cyclo-ligase [Blattabacterium cuenoti]